LGGSVEHLTLAQETGECEKRVRIFSIRSAFEKSSYQQEARISARGEISLNRAYKRNHH